MDEEKYARFVKAAKEMASSHGKKVVGWQEMARAGVSPQDLVQHWIRFSAKQMAAQASGSSNAVASAIPAEVRVMLGATYMKAPSDLVKAAGAGVSFILSPNAFCYLDCPFEEMSSEGAQNEIRNRLGMR